MSTKRSSRSTASKTSGGTSKADEVKSGSESKIFLIKRELLSENDLEIVNLSHPGTGSSAKFIIHEQQVYEIMAFQERYRSWFIGQSVVANGNLYMTTCIDPLFLAIPLLITECKERAVPIENLFMDTDSLKTGRLLEVFSEDKQLELVADVKRSGDIKALKYNEEKVLSWLERKCEKLVPKLRENRIHCGTAATSANFVKSEKLDTELDSKDDILRFAYFIVADYIPEELGERLLKKLGIELKSDIPTPAKKEATGKVKQNGNSLKRSSLAICDDDDEDNKDDTEDIKPVIKKIAAEVKVSSKSKAMAKAASGSKSISSFFKKA